MTIFTDTGLTKVEILERYDSTVETVETVEETDDPALTAEQVLLFVDAFNGWRERFGGRLRFAKYVGVPPSMIKRMIRLMETMLAKRDAEDTESEE